jgi:V/A-type H+-transporting ATPase subunit E
MQESVQALTEKIYQEGVVKAEARGEEIIAEAKQKALNIVNQAEAKAEDIIAKAEQKAADLKTKVDAELRLSARQAIGSLKQKMTDLIIWEVTKEPIENAFENTEFVIELIEKLVDYWLANFGQEEHLRILLPEADYKRYQEFIEGRAQELLKKGMTVEFKGKMSKGFMIETQDQRFKVSFTDDDFENYFRTFARPRTYKLLFGEEEK